MKFTTIAKLASFATIYSSSVIISEKSFAFTSPEFSIGNGGNMTWTEAVQEGLIQPADNPLGGFAAQQFYQSQIGMDMFGQPVQSISGAENITLTPDVIVSNPNGQLPEYNSLVMSWDNIQNDDPTVLNVAAWDYIYPTDPDLTNSWITFSLRAPIGIWDFSLELFDSEGRSRGWFGNPPGDDWTVLMVDPELENNQGFSDFYSEPGFDITEVVRIRLNESTQGGTFSTEVDPITGLIEPWNAWNTLKVEVHTPEPSSTIGILALGILGGGATLKRKLKSVNFTEK